MTAMPHFAIATVAESSADFRRVLWTGKHTQLVIMTIPPGGEIGLETHDHNDQILTFVSGTGEATVGGDRRTVTQGDLVIVPAGTEHNFVNTGRESVGAVHGLRSAGPRRRGGAPHQGGGRRRRGRRARRPTGLLTSAGPRFRGQRSLPAYDRLKLLLAKGKSGTIVSASATGRAGQLKNDGSTILTLVSRPALISTRCTMVPRHPSTMPTPEPVGRGGCSIDSGIVAGRGPHPRDEIGDQGDGLLDLVDAHQESGQHVTVGGPWPGGRDGHAGYRVIAPGVDGQSARPGDVAQRPQIDGLLAGEHGRAGEPVANHAVTHCEGGDLADVGADRGQPFRVGQLQHVDTAQPDAAAQQSAAGDLIVDPQQVLLHPLRLVVQDRMPDVVAQCADVGDVVVHPLQLEQHGPHLSIGHGNLVPQASSTAWQNARVCPTEVSPLIRSASSIACAGGLPSKSFSMPRCTNHKRTFRFRMVSPTTENRK